MRRDNDILKTLIIVFAGLIIVTLIALIVYWCVASKKLKGIEMTPDFPGTELEVGTQYSFTIKANPEKASLKKLKCIVDDPTCVFEFKDDSAILTTGINEGTVTVYVECGEKKSQVMTFSVVDSAARAQAEAAAAAAEAQAQAEEEATAAEEAQAAEEVKLYVKCTGDDVNVRASNSKDSESLGKAKNGQPFEKVEDVDDWTHILYDGKDAYMKTEFLTEISETQYFEALQSMENSTEEDKKDEEKKEEEKKQEENDNNEEQGNATQSKEEAEAKAKADQEAQAAAELQAQMEALAAAQAASGNSLECADGTHNFTSAQYNFLKGFWQREGQTSPDDWKVYAHKHTYDECVQICQIEGGIY